MGVFGLKRPCLEPRCPNLTDDSRCPEHAKKFDRDRISPDARKLYKNSRWRKERAAFLAEHPLCDHCLEIGRTTAATVVDHIIPHRGNQKVFWDQNNWSSLCAMHHGAKTAQYDGSGSNPFGIPKPRARR